MTIEKFIEEIVNPIFEKDLINNENKERIYNELIELFEKNCATINNEEKNKFKKELKQNIDMISAYNKLFDYINNNFNEVIELYIDKLYDSLENLMMEKFMELMPNLEETSEPATYNFSADFLEEKFYNFKKTFYETMLNDLNDNLLERILKQDKEKVDNFFSNLFEENEEKINIKISEKMLKKFFEKEIYSIVYFINDETFEKLSEKDIQEALKTIGFSKLNQEKQNIITNKIKFKDLLICLSNNSEYENYRQINKICSSYSYIDEESFNYALEKGYFAGLNNNEYVINNEKYVKKLIEKEDFVLLLYLPKNMINDELIDYIIKHDYGLTRTFTHIPENKPKVLAESKETIIKLAKEINYQFKNFLDYIENEEYIKEVMPILMLNGMEVPNDDKYKKYYSRSTENIQLALNLGYVANNNTTLRNEEEVKAFILNGQPQIIDIICKKNVLFSPKLFELALENGYKYNENSKLNDMIKYMQLPVSEIEEIMYSCLKTKHQDYIIEFMKPSNKAYDGTNNIILKRLSEILFSLKGNESYIDFLEKNNILQKYLDLIIFEYGITKIDINTLEIENNFAMKTETLDFDEIIRKKYNNYDEIMTFITNKNINKELKITKENVNIYFDKNKPTKAFYDYALFCDDDTFIKIFNDDLNYEEIYKNDQNKLGLIKTRKIYIGNDEIAKWNWDTYDWRQIEKNVDKYFNASGPTKAFYDLALFEKDLFGIFDHDFAKEIYSNDIITTNYIKFAKEVINIDYKKIKENISEYFDELGPTKKMLDEYLLLENFKFLRAFDDSIYENRYQSEPKILAYINFRKQYPNIVESFFANKILEDKIEPYFDEKGPNSNLYEIIFEKDDSRLHKALETDYFKEYYKNNPSILYYANLITKYGNIFKDYIKFNEIEKYFDENGCKETLKIYFRENNNVTDYIFANIAHNNNVINNISNDLLDIFEYYIIENYFKEAQNPKEQYKYLVDKLGCGILLNLENENIKKMITTDTKELDKFFDLFKNNNKSISNQDTYNNFIISLINLKFKKEHRDITEVFTNINSLIVSIPKNELLLYLETNIRNNQNIDELNRWIDLINNTLDLDVGQKEDLKKAIIECKNLNEQPLRKICRIFLEKYQKDHHKYNEDKILKEFGINPTFDLSDCINKLSTNYMQQITFDDFVKFRNILIKQMDYEKTSGFIEKLNMKKEEYDMVLSITKDEFNLITQAIRNRTKPDESVKRKFGLFKRFITQFSRFNINNNLVSIEELSNLNPNLTYEIPLEKINFLNIIKEFDIEIFLNSINNNPEIYKNLKKLIESYGLGRLPSCMEKEFEEKYKIDLPGGINNIGKLIYRYEQILKNKQRILKAQGTNVNLEEIRFTFTEIIKIISSTNSETYELRRLIGRTEYQDFIGNAGPNSAPYDKSRREDKLALIIDYLYTENEITIPSHDIIIESKKNNKKINFIIGNRTNPSNICHGERTGACMRVGGVGEGLFLKCLTDKNWFHIRIEDPETHEYISRVSGFRNGNTVYLNQLRYVPNNSKYTNEDLQEYIKIYAETLIEETKESEFPVENVFINTGYAMGSANQIRYSLGYGIQKEYNLDNVKNLALRDSRDIWTDVKTQAFLLATTEEGKKTKEGYIPLKNGPENTEIYECTRDKIYGLKKEDNEIPNYIFVKIELEELFEKINRVDSMKEKLLGNDYRFDIANAINEEILDGYASSDWYVYIDNNNEIHFDYIKEIKKENEIIKYNQAEKAQQEMEHYKNIIINKYSLSNEVKRAI